MHGAAAGHRRPDRQDHAEDATAPTRASRRSRSPVPARTERIRFAAIPMGHEFTSLVLALLQVGGHPPKIEQELIEQIKGLEGDLRFETYMSLTCHNCPDVVQALNLLAVLNPRIQSVVIDGGLYQQEVEDAPGAGRADGLPQRRAFRPGPDGSRRDRQEARHRRGRARRRQAERQGGVRRADRRRRPRRRGGGRVRGAQGHPHRPAGRAHGRPDDGHHEHRELHLGARRPTARSSPRRWSSTPSATTSTS